MHELITHNDRGRMVPFDRAALERAVAEGLSSNPEPAAELRSLGIGLIALERYDEAADVLGRALTAAAADGDAKREFAVRINLGDAHRYAGRSDEAEPHYQAALQLARDAVPEWAHFALQHLGKQRLDQRRSAEARSYLLEALKLREAMGDVALIESTRAALRMIDEV